MTPELIQMLMYGAFAIGGYFLKHWMTPAAQPGTTPPGGQPVILPTPAPTPLSILDAIIHEILARQAHAEKQVVAERFSEMVMTTAANPKP